MDNLEIHTNTIQLLLVFGWAWFVATSCWGFWVGMLCVDMLLGFLGGHALCRRAAGILGWAWFVATSCRDFFGGHGLCRHAAGMWRASVQL